MNQCKGADDMDFRVTNAYSVQKLYAAQKTQAVKKSTPLTAQVGDYFAKQIESGTYHVPPHNIAAKLLDGVR
jgi:anti-sigma28 factor (negative regulator of flagellin synthesis)